MLKKLFERFLCRSEIIIPPRKRELIVRQALKREQERERRVQF
jgi:hypothetical protein